MSWLLLGACDENRSARDEIAPRGVATSLSTAAPPARAVTPPRFAFVPPQPWQSTHEDVAEVPPPDLTRESWRALSTRNLPHETKTPRWQPLPFDRSVELAMPAGSAFRCLVTPLEVTPQPNDFGNALEAWLLARKLLCSSDGFRSWTEHVHAVKALPDGSREVTSQGGVLLREQGEDLGPRHSYVVVRADPEPRFARKGPPQVLPGVKVLDD